MTPLTAVGVSSRPVASPTNGNGRVESPVNSHKGPLSQTSAKNSQQKAQSSAVEVSQHVSTNLRYTPERSNVHSSVSLLQARPLKVTIDHGLRFRGDPIINQRNPEQHRRQERQKDSSLRSRITSMRSLSWGLYALFLRNLVHMLTRGHFPRCLLCLPPTLLLSLAKSTLMVEGRRQTRKCLLSLHEPHSPR
jgi:hypothetical protein